LFALLVGTILNSLHGHRRVLVTDGCRVANFSWLDDAVLVWLVSFIVQFLNENVADAWSLCHEARGLYVWMAASLDSRIGRA
jgi:hypothetical protein